MSHDDDIKTTSGEVANMMLSLGYSMYEGALRERFEREKKSAPKCSYCEDSHTFQASIYRPVEVNVPLSDREIRDAEYEAKQSKSKKKVQKTRKQTEWVLKKSLVACECSEGQRQVREGVISVTEIYGEKFYCENCREKRPLNGPTMIRLYRKQLICMTCYNESLKITIHERMLELASNTSVQLKNQVQLKLKAIYEKIEREFYPERYPADPWAELKNKMKARALDMGLIENG